jgi:hypothetical protein
MRRSFCAGTSLLSLQDTQVKDQEIDQARLANGRFARGYSGNPRGPQVYHARQQAARKHSAALLKALVAELGKLSPVDLAFAEAACDMLAKAQVSDRQRDRLTLKASKIIDRLRERYAPQKADPLDAYLARRADSE